MKSSWTTYYPRQPAMPELGPVPEGGVNPAIGQYQQRLDAAMKMLEGLGEQGRKDLAQRYRGRESAGVQDLVSRGLTGSTVMPTVRMGYQREHESELGRLNESLRQQQLGVYGQMSGELAGAQQQDYWQRQQASLQNYWQGQRAGIDQQRLALDRSRLNAQQNVARQGYAPRAKKNVDFYTVPSVAYGQPSGYGAGRFSSPAAPVYNSYTHGLSGNATYQRIKRR